MRNTDKSNQDKKKDSSRGMRLLVITGIAVVLLSAMALYLMRPSPVEQDVGLIDEEESEEDKVFDKAESG
ncbi:MAG TPA: hypothetical protein PLW98_08620 [Bacillota bacterium]|nr:hypothetical protein [Bacillota bacterium]